MPRTLKILLRSAIILPLIAGPVLAGGGGVGTDGAAVSPTTPEMMYQSSGAGMATSFGGSASFENGADTSNKAPEIDLVMPVQHHNKMVSDPSVIKAANSPDMPEKTDSSSSLRL
ncbi:MAG: hypothetical protein WCD16_08865 [Paracoccaceae bacterium]